MPRKTTAAIVAVYVAAITAANLLVAHYGPAVTIVNAFVLIGLDLASRDYLHDAWPTHRAAKMGALIGTAGFVSYLANPAAQRIALASVAAFAVSALLDYAVYTRLHRHPWHERSFLSNVAGAAGDSVMFPALAFGFPLLWLVMAGQFGAKVGGGAVWTFLYGRVRRAPVALDSVTFDRSRLAYAFAQMHGRATPTVEDDAEAGEAYAAARIAAGQR